MNDHPRVSILTLSCKEASRLVSEGLDRELTTKELWALRIHTFLCSACRNFAKQMRLLRTAFGLAPEPLRVAYDLPTIELSAERRAAIKRMLSDPSSSGPAPSDGSLS